jgi:hypothetical protein
MADMADSPPPMLGEYSEESSRGADGSSVCTYDTRSYRVASSEPNSFLVAHKGYVCFGVVMFILRDSCCF